ncbi:alpha/beta hydrolase [Streptomyces triculaminicus]|uniref:Alpha/beta hydrolase n=2 Tax=Streptomyces TaxID=1883 RepID=A0A939FL92_9ACTN|nr:MULTISPECIES: alpha/beta fold hydrolase [Streptomyces]MBO0653199.1 alpha/beta hydrolase [Streptomyces triculaminicus]QSY48088.1 alpha/beta hydrolase [Streptomyces griseocarneus]
MDPRRAAALTAATVIGAGAAAVAAGRYAGDAALKAGPGRPPPGEARIAVHDTGPGTVTLTRTPAALRPGTYGLTGRGVHAVVGGVVADVSHPHHCVVRRLERVAHGSPRQGDHVWLTPRLHAGNPRDALGLDHADVDVPGELGPLPAWFVPAARDTWVITVHGLGTTREHAMNLLPFLHAQRLPVLAVTYRGDPGAPRPAHGISHFGAREWRDLDAALRYALRNGARRVVLHGWSTGATMALLAAQESSLGRHVAGLVLDSPVLDWPAALRALAAHRVPAPLIPLAVRATEGRIGLAPGSLLDAADPAHVSVPTLVVHGTDDPLAPLEHSRELAAGRPELITLRTVRGAGHAGSWNVDPAGYEETLRRFLIPLM